MILSPHDTNIDQPTIWHWPALVGIGFARVVSVLKGLITTYNADPQIGEPSSVVSTPLPAAG